MADARPVPRNMIMRNLRWITTSPIYSGYAQEAHHLVKVDGLPIGTAVKLADDRYAATDRETGERYEALSLQEAAHALCFRKPEYRVTSWTD